jgi:hypothetical protein
MFAPQSIHQSTPVGRGRAANTAHSTASGTRKKRRAVAKHGAARPTHSGNIVPRDKKANKSGSPELSDDYEYHQRIHHEVRIL